MARGPDGSSPPAAVAGRRAGLSLTAPAVVICVVLAVAIGTLSALNPLLGVVAVTSGLVVVALGLAARRLADVALGALLVILAGYAFLGRGFAYLGVAPVFVGEIVLVLLVVAWVVGPRRTSIGPLHVLLGAFMGWGAVCTIPYVPVYGIDALRDAVTWGYGIFALVLSGLIRRHHLAGATRVVARVLPVFILWVPVAGLLTRLVDIPPGPGSSVPLIFFKGGDMGVHLAGVAAFVILGLYTRSGAAVRIPEALVWVGWLVAVAVAGIFNRGGLVAAAMTGATLLFARSAGRWLSLVFVALLLLVPIAVIDPRVDVGGEREVSFGQMVENVTSVFGEAEDAGLEGTEAFRLAWWSTIVGYTVDGPYFWTGKGYGINLADEDGFQPTADRSLRAPHNGHIEILARSGVPGLVLWVVLQLTFAVTMFRAAQRARVLPDSWWSSVIGWLFITWLAALVNSSFDPYLQGPQGGIWFWSVFGAGLAAVAMAEQEIRDHRAQGSVAEGISDGSTDAFGHGTPARGGATSG